MAEANWYVVHTYSGYENKVKVDIEKTIENRKLQDEILEVRVPLEMKPLGIQIGGEQQETPAREKIELDIEVGDMIVVTSGAWEGTTSAVTAINESKQTVTIEVEMFGRATSVEIDFLDIKKA